MSFSRHLFERELAELARRHGLRLVRDHGGRRVLIDPDRDMLTARFEPEKPSAKKVPPA